MEETKKEKTRKISMTLRLRTGYGELPRKSGAVAPIRTERQL